jgi:hypothetical protein
LVPVLACALQSFVAPLGKESKNGGRRGREEVLKKRGGKLETKAKTAAKNVLAFFGAISFVEIVLFFGL